MASYKKRVVKGRVTWRVRWMDHYTGNSGEETTYRESDAKRLRAEMELVENQAKAALTKGHTSAPVVTDSTPFRKYAELWLAARELSPSSLQSMKSRLDMLDRCMPDITLAHLNIATSKALVASLRRLTTVDGKRTYSARTIRQAYVLYVGIVHGAEQDQLITQVVLQKKVDLPKSRESKKAIFLTEAERELILSAFLAAEPRYHALVMLLFETGLRIGEMAALEKADVNLFAKTVTVSKTVSTTKCIVGPTKSGKTRVVPISPEMVTVLRRYLRDYPTTSKRLFTTHRGTQLRPTVFRQRVWRDIVASANDWVTVPMPHACRHYFASSMIMSGVPLLTVSRLLGHANIGITSDIYGHLSPDAGVAALAQRDAWRQSQRDLDHRLMGSEGLIDGMTEV